MLSGGKAQQRCGIVCQDAVTHLFDNGLVAAHFHVLVGVDEGYPDQRIKPVDAQGQKRQRLNDMVAAANVVLLMTNDVGLLPLLHIRGKIDLRSN